MTIEYIMSMTFCLAILFVFYKLLLDRDKAYHIKRSYLLLALIFSVVAPLITVYHLHIDIKGVADLSFISEHENTLIGNERNSVSSSVIPLVYILILVALLFRFAYNYIIILWKIYNNQTQVFKRYTLVFLVANNDEGPYSFGRYVFVQKTFYESDNWDVRLLAHELSHVTQRHSLDIILVELLKCVFWFQPFIYLYQKEIKFNHELLADDAVIQKYRDPVSYQSLLYKMIETRNRYTLVSSLDYSLTKKRFQMIKKKPDRHRSIITAILSIPVFVGLLLCVGQTAYAQNPSDKEQTKEGISKDEFYKNVLVGFEGESGVSYKKYPLLTNAEKAKIPPPPHAPSVIDKPISTSAKPLSEGSFIVLSKNGNVRLQSEYFIVPPPPPPPSNILPPPPPPPPSAIEIIKTLHKQGGTIYYGENVISKERALEIAESQNPLSIKTFKEGAIIKVILKN